MASLKEDEAPGMLRLRGTWQKFGSNYYISVIAKVNVLSYQEIIELKMGGWSKEVERHSILNRSQNRSFLDVKRPNSETLPLFAVSSVILGIINYRKDSRKLRGSKPLPEFVGHILKRWFEKLSGGRRASNNSRLTTTNNSNPRKMAGEAAASRAQAINYSSSNVNQKKKKKKKKKKNNKKR